MEEVEWVTLPSHCQFHGHAQLGFISVHPELCMSETLTECYRCGKGA
jgi:hypothetical protein